MECELLQSPMISYRSLLYNTNVLYDYIYRAVHIVSRQDVRDRIDVIHDTVVFA